MAHVGWGRQRAVPSTCTSARRGRARNQGPLPAGLAGCLTWWPALSRPRRSAANDPTTSWPPWSRAAPSTSSSTGPVSRRRAFTSATSTPTPWLAPCRRSTSNAWRPWLSWPRRGPRPVDGESARRPLDYRLCLFDRVSRICTRAPTTPTHGALGIPVSVLDVYEPAAHHASRLELDARCDAALERYHELESSNTAAAGSGSKRPAAWWRRTAAAGGARRCTR